MSHAGEAHRRRLAPLPDYVPCTYTLVQQGTSSRRSTRSDAHCRGAEGPLLPRQGLMPPGVGAQAHCGDAAADALAARPAFSAAAMAQPLHDVFARRLAAPAAAGRRRSAAGAQAAPAEGSPRGAHDDAAAPLDFGAPDGDAGGEPHDAGPPPSAGGAPADAGDGRCGSGCIWMGPWLAPGTGPAQPHTFVLRRAALSVTEQICHHARVQT